MLLQYRPKELLRNKYHLTIAMDDHVIMHDHEFLEFSYVDSGSMIHQINGKSNFLNPGDYFIVDHGTEHSYQQISPEPLKVINILFLPEFLDRTLVGCQKFEDVVNSYLLRFNYNSFRMNPTGETFHDDTGMIRKKLALLEQEYQEKNYGYIEYSRCLFVEILILAVRTITRADYTETNDEIIAEILEDIGQNYAGKHQLSDYARKHNYSVAQLSKRFTAEVGLSFSSYLQHCRIEQSCRLLQQTDQKVHEIAETVGYNDTKYFNQVFKNTLGITPREYRKTHPLIPQRRESEPDFDLIDSKPGSD